MPRSEKRLQEKVQEAVQSVLGAERLRGIQAELSANDDGETIAWFRIVYGGDVELSLAEMQKIKELIRSENEPSAPFPVVSFLEEREFAAQ